MKSFIPTAAMFAGAVLLAGCDLNAAGTDDFPPLNDPPTETRLAGKFIWADLFTTDSMTAAKFYEAMFGWSPTIISREGRRYILLKHDGRAIAGIVPRPPGGANAPRAKWVSYFAVQDMARSLARVASAGGKVLAPARDFPRRGTQAIVADDRGAVLGLLFSTSGDPEDYRAELGDWIWAELFTKQPEATTTFYQRVFGYEVRPMSAEKERFILGAGGFARAGIGPVPANEDAPPAWLAFVRVENADAAAARAAQAGGRVLVAPQLSHLGTRFALVADPAGAAVAVIEFDVSATSLSPP